MGAELIDMTPYTGDDYPRAGCTLNVTVREGYVAIMVLAPNGAPVESFGGHYQQAVEQFRQWLLRAPA